MNLKPIAKAIAAGVFAVGSWGFTAAKNGISTEEWFGLLIALAAPYVVYQTPWMPAETPAADGLFE